MGDILPPGGGPIYVNPADGDEQDDLDQYVVCADCNTHMLVGDQEFCQICKKAFCEDCFEDHDCGFLAAQAEARDL